MRAFYIVPAIIAPLFPGAAQAQELLTSPSTEELQKSLLEQIINGTFEYKKTPESEKLLQVWAKVRAEAKAKGVAPYEPDKEFGYKFARVISPELLKEFGEAIENAKSQNKIELWRPDGDIEQYAQGHELQYEDVKAKAEKAQVVLIDSPLKGRRLAKHLLEDTPEKWAYAAPWAGRKETLEAYLRTGNCGDPFEQLLFDYTSPRELIKVCHARSIPFISLPISLPINEHEFRKQSDGAITPVYDPRLRDVHERLAAEQIRYAVDQGFKVLVEDTANIRDELEARGMKPLVIMRHGYAEELKHPERGRYIEGNSCIFIVDKKHNAPLQELWPPPGKY